MSLGAFANALALRNANVRRPGGKPDEGELHVRFGEGLQETSRSKRFRACFLLHTLDGALARVWQDFDTNGMQSASVPGYIRHGDEIGIHLLKPNRMIGEVAGDTLFPRTTPNTLVATSEVGGTLFFHVSRVKDSDIIGGARASTRHYRAGGAVVGFAPTDLNTTRMYSMSAYFPGLTLWSNIRGMTAAADVGGEYRPRSWTTTVAAAEEERSSFGRTHSLVISTYWSVTGPDDDRRVFAPLEVSSESTKPVDWLQHILVLSAIQDLLGLAYEGYVTADGGDVALDVAGDRKPNSAPKLWSSELMERRAGIPEPKSMNEMPLFRYETVGGIDGLKRWVRLCREHGRATGPLVAKYRIGSSAVESQLNDVANAIEYWVNYHKRRNRGWANRLGRRDWQSKRLARYVGQPFEELVGDAEKWGKRFWDRYGDLKHESSLKYDANEIYLLAETGRILLACALLNRIALSKAPSKAICQSHRTHDLGVDVRDLLGV